MLIGRMQKETPDVRRCTIDFGKAWLDDGEQVTDVTEPLIELMGSWVPGPYPSWPDNTIPATVLPPDPTPLNMDFWIVLPGGKLLQMFTSSGTPGNFYRISLTASGTSGRAQTVELIMAVKHQPSG